MIYINVLNVESLVLNTKFQDARSFGSVEDFLCYFAFYIPGKHLGHVTWAIYINFISPFLRMHRMIGQAVSEEVTAV